jgi:hypothetical protein
MLRLEGEICPFACDYSTDSILLIFASFATMGPISTAAVPALGPSHAHGPVSRTHIAGSD